MANVPIGVFMTQALPKGVTDPDATNFEIQQLERENRALASVLQSDTKGEYVRKLKERNEQLKRGIPVAPIPQQPVPVEVVNDKRNLVHENEPSRIRVAPANTQSSGSNGAQPPSPGQPKPDTSGNPGAKILVEGATDPDSKSPQEKKTLESLGQGPAMDEVHINPPPNPEGEAPREDTTSKVSLDTTKLQKQEKQMVDDLYSLYNKMAESSDNDLPQLSEQEFLERMGNLVDKEPNLLDTNSMGVILQKLSENKIPSAFAMYVDDPLHINSSHKIRGKKAVMSCWTDLGEIQQVLQNFLDIVTNPQHPYYKPINDILEARRIKMTTDFKTRPWYASFEPDANGNRVYKFHLVHPASVEEMLRSMIELFNEAYQMRGDEWWLKYRARQAGIVMDLGLLIEPYLQELQQQQTVEKYVDKLIELYDTIRNYLLGPDFGARFPEDEIARGRDSLPNLVKGYNAQGDPNVLTLNGKSLTGFGIDTHPRETHIQL